MTTQDKEPMTRIAQLSDDAVVAALQAITQQARLVGPALPEIPQPELRALLGGIPLETEPVAGADFPRTLLTALAQTPAYEQVVRDVLASGPIRGKETFTLSGLEVVLFTASILLLQTHFKLERTPNGRWHLLIEKKPAKDSLLGKALSALKGYWAK